MNNNDFNFCVWDSNNGDFLETFKTLKEAFSFCKRCLFNGLIVGRWDRDENGDFLDSYTPIKYYPAFNYELKMGYHCKNINLFSFLEHVAKNTPNRLINCYKGNFFEFELSAIEACKMEHTKNYNNFNVTSFNNGNYKYDVITILDF